MKLYDGGRAPNPRRVRIFLAEKGIEIEKQQVDIASARAQGTGLYGDQSVAAGTNPRSR